MTPLSLSGELPALLVSLTVAGAAIAWVRPSGLLARSPQRPLPSARSGAHRPNHPCPSWFVELVEPAVLPVTVEQAWLAVIGALTMSAILGTTMGGPGLALVVVPATAGAIWLGLRSARHRLHQVVQRGVPDSLDSIARSTRSGRSVVQALADLDTPGASAADLRLASVGAQVERGTSLHSALSELTDSCPVPAIRLAATALIIGSQTGAPPARAVEGVAATLRDRLALDHELSAQSSQARASVAVMVLAPLGFGLFAMATDPRVGEFLLRSPIGWACLTLGLGLDAVGAWWMRRIMAGVR